MRWQRRSKPDTDGDKEWGAEYSAPHFFDFKFITDAPYG